ncbi:hypothetical protein Scep_021931 [Stephania cephalantha]|uniref:Uncharacterized protein n=1 Tax=Stephania cephalantha TaxID=152367 RepID=A0AAP0I0L2_9MAGN
MARESGAGERSAAVPARQRQRHGERRGGGALSTGWMRDDAMESYASAPLQSQDTVDPRHRYHRRIDGEAMAKDRVETRRSHRQGQRSTHARGQEY